MAYWKDRKNVEEYIKLAEGFDGRELIERLKEFIPPGSTVLELGMGPGKDLDILLETYVATGTDISSVFIELYKKEHENADVFVLDATELHTDRKYDCVYSNKALQHLSTREFKLSLRQQGELLNPSGILFHSLWQGEGEEKFGEMFNVYYSREKLENIVKEDFTIVELSSYKEMEENDSLLLVLKPKLQK